MSDTILDEVREILQKSSTTSFGQGYVIGLVAELEATQGVLSRVQEARADDIARAEKAEDENARLRERLESALDKISDIEEDSNAHTSEGVCHACGICADCPQDWQPTDDHCCRVMLEMWVEGKPLPWEAARRAVADEQSEGTNAN
ncbi:hypothetical protein [uncultured Desulfovibrio sp.]|uniref:hypothetical protein n=1 Tax=uncultured Desulfovibrio sp. TaxID=167968 RepID=UPI002051B04C|nr:hypothetical protein [uncultured Desulfovibrio sp.]DAJ56728.1 MAG TPA: langerin binding protein [Caudoviricetes sp.]